MRAMLPMVRQAVHVPGAPRGGARDAAIAMRRVRALTTTAGAASWGRGSSAVSGQLREAEERANMYPDHPPYQAAYSQLLNRAGMHEEVLRRYESGKFAFGREGLPEVMEATTALFGSGSASFDGLAEGRHHAGGQGFGGRGHPPPPPPGGVRPQGQASQTVALGSEAAPLSVTVVPGRMGTRDYIALGFRVLSGALVLFLLWRLLNMAPGEDGGMLGALGGKTKAVDEDGAVPDVSFEDVKGVDDAKKELQDVVAYLREPERFQALGARVPRGVLLTGPPGTGKTLLARAVAGESGVKFYNKSAAEFEEVFVGLGAKRVRELFESAKANSPAIIFIDEIDAVGGKRRSAGMGRAGTERQTLNQLLAAMDGFDKHDNVIVIAATNDPESLDSALRRPGRFDSTVDVSPPDVAGRVETFQLYLGRVTVAEGVDATTLAKATPGFTGAQIEAIVNSAAIIAASRGASEVDMGDLEEAMDKSWMGPAHRSRKKTAAMMRLTAFHESGHTLAALLTPGAKELHKVTVLGRGSAGGVTHFFADDSAPQSRHKLLADMDVAFGGLVAEELCNGYDNVTTGPFSDLQHATEVARRYVKYFGMSKVGFSQYSQEHQESEAHKERVDEEVERLLQESYARVKSLLQANWHKVSLLAEALTERETLTAEEVRVVTEGGSLPSLEQVLAKKQAERGAAQPTEGKAAQAGAGQASGKGKTGDSKPPTGGIGWLMPPVGMPSPESIWGSKEASPATEGGVDSSSSAASSGGEGSSAGEGPRRWV